MLSNNTEPELLLEYARDGLVDQEHYGFIVLADKKRAFDFTGDAKNYPFYLRSCAKPLQANSESANILNRKEQYLLISCKKQFFLTEML